MLARGKTADQLGMQPELEEQVQSQYRQHVRHRKAQQHQRCEEQRRAGDPVRGKPRP